MQINKVQADTTRLSVSCIFCYRALPVGWKHFPPLACTSSRPARLHPYIMLNKKKRQKCEWHWSSQLTLSEKVVFFPYVQPLHWADGRPEAANTQVVMFIKLCRRRTHLHHFMLCWCHWKMQFQTTSYSIADKEFFFPMLHPAWSHDLHENMF